MAAMDWSPEAVPARPAFDYSKLPFRRQPGAGLAKAPAEVKRIIARECYAQDCALLETRKKLEKRFDKHNSAPATLRGLESLRQAARTSAMLRLVSREWNELVTPYFFSEFDMLRFRKVPPVIEEHKDHVRSLRATGNRQLLDWVLENMPNIEEVDLSSPTVLSLQAESMPALLSRATTIRGLDYACLFTGPVRNLPSFQSLRHLGVSVSLFPIQDAEIPRQLWTLLGDAPHLRTLEIYVEVKDQPDRPCNLRPLLPPASCQIPALSHLGVSTNMFGDELVGLSELIDTFATTLVTLGLKLLDDQGLKSDATFRLPDGDRFPLLRKLELECAWEEQSSLFDVWKDPPASLRHLVIRIQQDDSPFRDVYELVRDSTGYYPPTSLAPFSLAKYLGLEIVELLGSDRWVCEHTRSETRDPTTGIQIRLHPPLYPPLAETSRSTQSSLSWPYKFQYEDDDDDEDEPADSMQAFEVDGLVNTVDEMLDYLAAWRDRAVKSGDVVGLQQLARTLVDADFARVVQRV